MVVLSLISRLQKYVATPMLRSGLSLRYLLGGGVIRDSPILDAFSFVPFAQKLISIEAHDDAKAAEKAAAKEPTEPTAFDKFVDVAWDRLFEDGAKDVDKSRNAASPPRAPSVDNPRLEALESYLRPALVPNEQWSDVARWQFNARFVKWARMEFLIAKYGGEVRKVIEKYPQLRTAQVSNRGPARMAVMDILGRGGEENGATDAGVVSAPSASLLAKAFGMEGWNREKNTDAGWDRMREITKSLGGEVVPIPGSAIQFPNIPPDADLSALSLEDLLEVVGGHVASLGPFNCLCEECGLYEFWTQEYISGLSSYLLDRTDAYDGDTVILDVGAGDGMLAALLRRAMEEEASKRSTQRRLRAKQKGSAKRGRSVPRSPVRLPLVVASDDGSWNIKPRADVETLNVRESLAKYSKASDAEPTAKQQVIVLCSWMPMGEDWTAEMRSGGADEIIVVGECDDGNCGDNWATWGNPQFLDDEIIPGDNASGHETEVSFQSTPASIEPPYKTDGFERDDLDQLSRLQFSRFDSSISSSSKTVSFKRLGKKEKLK